MTTQEAEKNTDLDRPVSFRLRPADKAMLMEFAAAQGLTPGQLARKIVARDLGLEAKLNHVCRAVANASVLRRLLGSLGHLGNNLNQIAAHLNGGGSQARAAKDIAHLRSALEEALEAIISTLKRSRS